MIHSTISKECIIFFNGRGRELSIPLVTFLSCDLSQPHTILSNEDINISVNKGLTICGNDMRLYFSKRDYERVKRRINLNKLYNK